ncbi:MAG: 23S rRNA (guanosine(2251)-2'-O)-methyltransferase RlmB [Gammaproteobacteria bacterium]|nr:23S rRNA (guanosine(2251)-2'-O)-methyltransferase RlmB [Gammaproteobacteria bacterium]
MSKSRYVTGLRAVEQLIAAGTEDIRRVFAEYQTANPRVQAVITAARKAGIEVQAANRARLAQLSGETRHQGIVAEVHRSTLLDEGLLRTLVEERLQQDKTVLLLLLDGVQDPHNLGACMRTADAAGVDAVVVPRHCAASLSPTVSKVAAGAAEQLPFAQVGNLSRVLGWLKDYGVRCVGTSDKAEKTLFDTDLSGSIALIMGREHSGLGKGLAGRCDELVSIPMQGAVSSLNVSVASAVCLYEILRQRG